MESPREYDFRDNTVMAPPGFEQFELVIPRSPQVTLKDLYHEIVSDLPNRISSMRNEGTSNIEVGELNSEFLNDILCYAGEDIGQFHELQYPDQKFSRRLRMTVRD